MKRIAGFLVLTSFVAGCNNQQAQVTAEGSSTLRVVEPVQAVAEFNDVPILAGGAVARVEPAEIAEPSEVPSPIGAGRALVPGKGEANDSPHADKASAGGKQTVSGAAVSGEGFTVQMQAASPVKVGEATTITVLLTAQAPFKCNDKYPYKFKFEPNPGVGFQSDVVRGMKIEGKQASLNAQVTAKAAGKQTVAGELSFSVCTPDKCLVEKKRLSVSFDVNG